MKKNTIEGLIKTYYIFIKPIICCFIAISYGTKYRSIAFTVMFNILYQLLMYLGNWIGIAYIGYLYSIHYKRNEIDKLKNNHNIKESQTIGYQMQHVLFCILVHLSSYKTMMFWSSLLCGKVLSSMASGYILNPYIYYFITAIEIFYEQIVFPFYLQNEYRRHLRIGRRSKQFEPLSKFGYKFSFLLLVLHLVLSVLNYVVSGLLYYPTYTIGIGLLLLTPAIFYGEKLFIKE
jgi:hypothetical protein